MPAVTFQSIPTVFGKKQLIQQQRQQQAAALESTIRQRHSTRYFLPKPVPSDTIAHCLQLAQLSPSSSNVQPWRLFVVTGERLTQLKDALYAMSEVRPPSHPAIPDALKHYRSELGHEMYGPNGYNLDPSDREGAKRASLRNYKFFDAPCAMILCMPEGLARGDILSVGAYTQTLTLALTGNGLGSCIQVSVAGYADVMREQLNIPSDLVILCGIAVGYPDETSPINSLRVHKDEAEQHVQWIN